MSGRDRLAELVEAGARSRPDRMLAYGPHPDQVVELRGAAGPLVVVIHGGYWRPGTDRTHAGRMSDALALGARVATIEYRRIPGDPDATVADVRAAIAAAIAATGADDVTLVGHSAGGHLALLLAGEPGVSRVVALAPVADLVLADRLGLGSGAVRAFLGGAGSSRPELDPTRLPSPAVPVRILHGDADDVVPLAVAESYVAAHPEATLEVLEGADHFDVIDPDAAEFEQVRATVG